MCCVSLIRCDATRMCFGCLQVKGDGVKMMSGIWDEYWGECPECQYFPVTPVHSPGLKACVFDNKEDPTADDPFYYGTSMQLMEYWTNLDNYGAASYGHGGHCSVHSFVRCVLVWESCKMVDGGESGLPTQRCTYSCVLNPAVHGQLINPRRGMLQHALELPIRVVACFGPADTSLYWQYDMALCLDDGRGLLIPGGADSAPQFPQGSPTTLDTTTTTLPCTNTPPAFGTCVLEDAIAGEVMWLRGSLVLWCSRR